MAEYAKRSEELKVNNQSMDLKIAKLKNEAKANQRKLDSYDKLKKALFNIDRTNNLSKKVI